VYLGGGCLDAAPEVRDFIKRTGIPVASTLMGLGTYPAQDPLALQMLGMHGTVFANYSVDQVCVCGVLGFGGIVVGGKQLGA
jgi:acetolactate synthase-1/2/3 large subunit